jgi:hypothetical protein
MITRQCEWAVEMDIASSGSGTVVTREKKWIIHMSFASLSYTHISPSPQQKMNVLVVFG